MSTTEVTSKPITLKLRVLHVIRLAVATIARFFFNIYYGSGGKKLPPIADDILKVPAIEVAKKIREKENRNQVQNGLQKCCYCLNSHPVYFHK